MSASRRLQLLEWAQNSGSWIIEDDYDSEYRYESLPIASLQGLDSNSRVIYIGTFSKVLFPSLRLGYIVIPSDLVERFRVHAPRHGPWPPSFYQEVLSDFIREGHFARHIRRMRVLYRERRSALVDQHSARNSAPLVEVLGGRGWHACGCDIAKRESRSGNCRASRPPEPLAMAVVSFLYGRGVAPGLHPGFWQYCVDGDSHLLYASSATCLPLK